MQDSKHPLFRIAMFCVFTHRFDKTFRGSVIFMPIYKMDGKKDGLQRYHVCINYTDDTGEKRQLDKIAYSPTEAAALERQLLLDLEEEYSSPITLQQLADEYIGVKKNEVRETTAEKNVSVK